MRMKNKNTNIKLSAFYLRLPILLFLVTPILSHADCDNEGCKKLMYSSMVKSFVIGGIEKGDFTGSGEVMAFKEKCGCYLKLSDSEDALLIEQLTKYTTKFTEFEENRKKIQAKSDEQKGLNSTAIEKCKENNYANCFGLDWGKNIDVIEKNSSHFINMDEFKKVCPMGDQDRIIENSPIATCGTQIKNNVLIKATKKCAMIMAALKIDKGASKGTAVFVGVEKRFPDMTEAETMLVKSELRKKYGEPVKNESCDLGDGRGATSKYYQFNGQNGLEVTLAIANQVGHEKSGVSVRYLNLPSFQEAKKAAVETEAADKKKAKKEDLKSVKDAVNDL